MSDVLVRANVKLSGLRVGGIYPVELTRYVRAAIDAGHLSLVDKDGNTLRDAVTPADATPPADEGQMPPGSPQVVTSPPIDPGEQLATVTGPVES